MTGLVHHRLILVVALLCQVLTSVHVPMAQARTTGGASAALTHCPGHAHGTASDGTDRSRIPGTGHPHASGNAGSCGCGLCHCPCAQAPALMSALTFLADIAHVMAGIPYRAPDVPRLASRFFRPPI